MIMIVSELLSKEGRLTTHDGKTVTDLFPEFRPGQVLRFSRLFGPAKASSMPQQWRNAKKRKKKKKKQGEDEKTVIEQPKTPPSPRPEDCMSDDEVNNSVCIFPLDQSVKIYNDIIIKVNGTVAWLATSDSWKFVIIVLSFLPC